MSNAEVPSGVSNAFSAGHLGAGSFLGAMQAKREQCGATFTDLRPAAPQAPHALS